MKTDPDANQSLPLKNDRAEARSEIQEYLEVGQERHKLFPRAGLIGLCAGAVLVRCHAKGREGVRTTNMRLEAHTRITVVVAPDAEGALEALRRGCTAREEPADDA